MSYTTPSNRARTTASSSRSRKKSSSTKTSTSYSEVHILGGTPSPAIAIADDGFDRAAFSQTTPSKKRKREVVTIPDGSDDEYAASIANRALSGANSKTTVSKPKTKKGEKGEPVEKRLRQFRSHPPQSYLERLERAVSQRMFLIDRERKMGADGTHEEEVFGIAGTTGNIYQVTISKKPSCTCPDASQKGNQCKHIIYILVNVLKAPEHLQYQLAFLTAELAEIFTNAPVSPQSSDGSSEDKSDAGKRKPIEGDCPVCVMEFEAGEDILWCKAACGNNIHRTCFEQWAKSKPGEVKCVYCRTPWKGDEETVRKISKHGHKNEDGYVNVASELGLSGRRDYSTYHQPWVQSQRYSRYGSYGGY